MEIPSGVVDTVSIRRSRLVDKPRAADYLGTSEDTIDRLIATGALPVVRLPVENASIETQGGSKRKARVGVNRRILIDVRDLDALIDRSKETMGNEQHLTTRPPTILPRHRLG